MTVCSIRFKEEAICTDGGMGRTAELGKGDLGGTSEHGQSLVYYSSFVSNPSSSLWRPPLSHRPGSSNLSSPLSSSSSLLHLGKVPMSLDLASTPWRLGVCVGGIESLISEHEVGEEINSVSTQTRTYFLPPHSPAPSQDPSTLYHLKNPKDEQGWARRGGAGGEAHSYP